MANVNSELFGISVCTVSGEIINIGDTITTLVHTKDISNQEFTITNNLIHTITNYNTITNLKYARSIFNIDVLGNKIIIISGEDNTGELLKDIEIFNDSFTTSIPLEYNRQNIVF